MYFFIKIDIYIYTQYEIYNINKKKNMYILAKG